MKERLLAALAPALLLAAYNTAAPASVSVGSSVPLTATANDNVGVTSVKFYRGDTLLATDTAAPYEYTQTTTASDAGTLSFKVVASVTVKAVTAPDNTKPSVNVALTQIIGRSYSVTAVASDNVGVSKVEFYDNDVLIGTGTEAPSTAALSYPDEAAGPQVIAAKAYDAAGNIGESSAALTLSQEPLPAPPVVTPEITSNPVTQPGSVTVNAWTGRAAGIAQVEFLLDGVPVVLTQNLPYIASLPSFTSAQNGVHTVTVRVTDRRGQVSEASQKLTVAIDGSEPNDSVATAKNIVIGDSVNGIVAGQARDFDYFKVNAAAGDHLKLTVKGSRFSGGTLDPYVTVYLPDGKTVLEQNDDGGLGSEILFNVPASGTYIIGVTSFAIHDDPANTDNRPTNFYQLALTRR